MLKNKKKKKKGFTLIELVIVLAVLAIIALIAIPNFTRVRNNALVQADNTSSEQITNITQTAIAEGVLNPVLGNSADYTLTIVVTPANGSTPKSVDITLNDKNILGKDAAGVQFTEDILGEQHYRDIDAPQVAGTTGYLVTINKDDGTVTTKTTTN